MKDFQTTVITITRQMASGGSYIGQHIAKRLGFIYLDRQVLHETARQLGTDEIEVECCEERVANIWEEIMKSFTLGTPETAYIPPTRPPVYSKDLFEKESAIIRKTAETSDIVVVGRGGVQALRDHPRAVHVFLHAPKEFRVQRLMRVLAISDKRTARLQIEESDDQRDKFFRKMIGLEWTDARNYHLCMDTSKTGLAEAEEMIASLIGKLKKI